MMTGKATARPFKPRMVPMSLGSIPLTDPTSGWETVVRHFPEIPTWPQLPQRTFLENMYVQFSEGFPGLVIEDERIFVDRSQDLSPALERLYVAYLSDNVDDYAITARYAAGLWETERALRGTRPQVLKGQVTGPISWGLMVVDQDRRPILYDEVLADALARHLRMKASWQERYMRRFVDQTLMILDEPYLSAFGSAFVAIDQELVLQLLEETLAGLEGLRGIHCCGNTDWSLLLSTSIDVLSLDAYQFAHTLALYPEDLDSFLLRGGMVAWGIVPSGPEAYSLTAHTLWERLESNITALERKGLSRQRLLDGGFITPSCGMGRVEPALAERIFSMTREVSNLVRAHYYGSHGAEHPPGSFSDTDSKGGRH